MINNTNNIDAIERSKNARITRALYLYQDICDKLDHDGFTAREVMESCNCLTKKYGNGKNTSKNGKKLWSRVNYGKSGLDTLVELGMIERDEEANKYRVINFSPHVVRLEYFGQIQDRQQTQDYIADAEELDPTDETYQEYLRMDDYNNL
jgi:hypothetical protein